MRYLNIYENGEVRMYLNLEKANASPMVGKIACRRIEVEFEEGQFDE